MNFGNVVHGHGALPHPLPMSVITPQPDAPAEGEGADTCPDSDHPVLDDWREGHHLT